MRRGLCDALVLVVLAYSLPATSQVSFFQPLNFSGCSSFTADFNGDGKPDLLCSNGPLSPTNSVLNLGNGDGTFTAGKTVSGAVLAVADFNGDDKPDLLEQGTGTLLVLLGNGDGTFQAPISTASGAALLVVAAADLNGDGKADVVGVFNNSLYVYLGRGDGTFAPGVSYSLGVSSLVDVVLTMGDFNGDGQTDVAVSTGDLNVGEEVVFLGNGNGTFQAPRTSAGIGQPLNAVVGDFNGDGEADLALSSATVCANCPPVGVFLFLGNGDGTFQTPTVLFPYSGVLATADVNGDGKLDLIFSGDSSTVEVYLGKGDGTFSGPNSYAFSLPSPLAISASQIAIADFNKDGKLDLAVANGILLGNGDGTFQGIPLGIAPPFPPTYTTNPAYISGKFEKNGATDIVLLNGGQVYILHNNGAGVLTLLNTYTLPQLGTSIVAGDFNGDGNLDLAVSQTDSGTTDWGYSILLGNGDGSFQVPVYYPQSLSGSYYQLIYAADFNNDHKPDLLVTGVGDQSLAILLGNGDGTLTSPAYYYDSGSLVAAIADFNSDGNLDIAVPGTGILYGKGDGTFQPMTFPTSLDGFGGVLTFLTADFNNDGKPDLLGTNTSNQAEVALGNGDGTFTLLPAIPVGFVMAGVADFNGDGTLDLFGYTCCSDHFPIEGGVELGNGDGTFGSMINAPSTTNIADENVLFADMNGDGRIDIVFPWEASFFGVLLNTTSDFLISGSPTSQTLSAGQTTSFSLSLAASGKFNGTVNLSCAVTPAVTAGPTCTLSSASEQISGTTAQSVTVKVGTTAPSTAAMLLPIGLPPASLPFAWTLTSAVTLAGFSWMALRSRKCSPVLFAPVVLLVMLTWVGCGGSGGSGSSTSHTTPGTPAGTYTATVTATSRSLTHTTALKVTVQ